jgi:SAM-dependent methyltransferase
MERVIEQHVAGKGHSLVVDYGCGNMPYRPLFEPHVKSYVGCDFPGNELADFTLANSSLTPLQESRADIVLSTQVLEHVTEPMAYLEECKRLLRKGGLVILSTHGQYSYHPDPNDYWRWTSEGLKKIVTDSGFNLLSFRGILGPAAYGVQFWQDAVLPRVHWRLRKAFTYVMQGIIRMFDRRYSHEQKARDACVYLLVAQKPLGCYGERSSRESDNKHSF